MSTPAVVRSLAAEVRAVEEGHHARLVDGTVHVKSDTDDGVTWVVSAFTVGDLPQFTCVADRPTTGHARLTGEPGLCACKHAARAAHSMERRGLMVWVDGLWHLTDAGVALVAAERAKYQVADPWEGL